MKRLVIAVDVDEVLMPHFEELIDWYNARFGAKLTKQDNHPVDLSNWGVDSLAAALERVHEFYLSGQFRQTKPFPAAVVALKKLAESYDIIVVTARDTPLEQLTHDWLADHFEKIFNAVHFTRQYSLEGKSRLKSEVLKEQSVDYFIDDSLDNIIDAASAGIESLLFGDYAWNQAKKLPYGVTRCRDWAAVEAFFAAQ